MLVKYLAIIFVLKKSFLQQGVWTPGVGTPLCTQLEGNIIPILYLDVLKLSFSWIRLLFQQWLPRITAIRQVTYTSRLSLALSSCSVNSFRWSVRWVPLSSWNYVLPVVADAVIQCITYEIHSQQLTWLGYFAKFDFFNRAITIIIIIIILLHKWTCQNKNNIK